MKENHISFLKLEGATLHYECAGSAGPAILFVHGGLCRLTNWSRQMRELASDHRVIALDLRCHGQSTGKVSDCSVELYAKDVSALIDHLGVRPVILVGHSMGARVVAEAASRRPDNVAGVILLDGSRIDGGYRERMIESDMPQAGVSGTDPALMIAIRDFLIAWDETEYERAIAALSMPLLAIQSTYHDRSTPRRMLSPGEHTPYLEFLRRCKSDMTTAILPETGHFSMKERPEEVTGLIRDFAVTVFD